MSLGYEVEIGLIIYTFEVFFVDCRAFFETKLKGQVHPALYFP
jgi:hypothetical protein